MGSTSKNPVSFWVISIIALLWNLSGVYEYLIRAYMSDETLLSLPEADQAYYAGVPAWVTAAFATAVFAGALGCVLLLLRKKLSYTFFSISLIAVIIQFIYNMFIQNFVEVTGFNLAMTLVVVVVSVFLVWYSKKVEKLGFIS